MIFTYYPFFLFLLFFIVYIWLQFFSLLFERHFLVVVALLVGQSLFGVITTLFILYEKIHISIGLAIVIAAWSVIALTIVIIKLVIVDDLRVRSSKHVVRQRIKVGLEYNNICVETRDGVKISGFHIQKGHPQVIIVLHGGFRSKNSFENLSMSQWLSYDYDVISFDTRGHFESEGYWTGDGKTKLDLLAILDYAKSFQYQKIGVWGRSLGAWTAMLVAVENSDIDSLVIVSSPLSHIRQTPYVSKIEWLKSWPGRMIVRALIGLRYYDYNDSDTPPPMDIVEGLKIPTFLIYASEDKVVGLNENDVKSIYDLIPTSDKKLYIFPEVAHLPHSWHLGPIYRMTKEWFMDTMKN